MKHNLFRALTFAGILLLFTAFDGSYTSQDRYSIQTFQDFLSYDQLIPGSNEKIVMKPISGGEFDMGSDTGEALESPKHTVIVDAFWMGAHEITWDQYELFSQRKIDAFIDQGPDNEVVVPIDAIASASTPYVDMSHGMGKEDSPVVNITQHAAITFCKWLSAKTGKFYRLPTEAEWEYACRAGSDTEYGFGKDSIALQDYAWYRSNSNGKYHRVGQKKPNAFGLYDMHGNVAEWTLDQFKEDAYIQYAGETANNPWEKPVTLYPRTVRGGSWNDNAYELRSSARKGSLARWKRIDPQIPKSRWWFTNAPFVGFRIVRPKITPSKEEIDQYWLQVIEDF
ncbi:formylglycine-generating enzyme family protein [Spongiimicrobium sp. 3-5]|uniref:formylglycine-generating enzyme family protein n=1 Tax=Spongiimicrobium sp. 3-5 TaxID=3332596 RepID=UPI00398064E5